MAGVLIDWVKMTGAVEKKLVNEGGAGNDTVPLALNVGGWLTSTGAPLPKYRPASPSGSPSLPWIDCGIVASLPHRAYDEGEPELVQLGGTANGVSAVPVAQYSVLAAPSGGLRFRSCRW